MYVSVQDVVSHLVEWSALFRLLLLASVERVGDSLSLHTVEVSGNVDPCEHPDNFFGEVVVSTSGSVPPSFGFVVISKNVLWICTLPLAVSNRALLSVVSPSGYSVAQADVEIMVVEDILVDLQLFSALVPVPVCFFCLTL